MKSGLGIPLALDIQPVIEDLHRHLVKGKA